jgi:chromate transport protein ChrA
VVGTFLKIGVLSYGAAASMGIMQAEVQEKRAWLPKERFIEGLALVKTLPGPVGIQLGIFLGHSRAGWWGGVLAVGTVGALVLWRLSPLPPMAGGAAIGRVLRARLS